MFAGLINNRNKGTCRQRRLALFVCAVVILVTFLSFTYIIEENNHNCSGEDCPICAHIIQCEKNIRQIGSGFIVSLSIVAVSLLCVVSVSLCDSMISKESLISKKIRLNN